MALGDYILCCKCDTKLIYDGDRGNREWWQERFGEEPAILCPNCDKRKWAGLTEALAQPAQEPVVGTKTWFEDGKVVTRYLTAKDIYKEPAQSEQGEHMKEGNETYCPRH